VSALLAILAVYQHLTLMDVLLVQLAFTKPLQATEVHALLVLPATRQQEQARLSLQSALFAPLAMEAPQCRILDQPLADAPFAQLAYSKLMQATLFAQLVPTATQALSQEVLLPHLVVSALLAILVPQ